MPRVPGGVKANRGAARSLLRPIRHAIAEVMTRADFTAPRGRRLAVAVVVLLLHVALIFGLIRALAPEFTERIADEVFGAVTVTVATPPPEPSEPEPVPETAEPAGAAGEAGKRAVPKAAAAPRPRIVLATQPAPPVAGSGTDDASGAHDAGQGTGAGGQGSGTGSGAGGSGTGGGAAKAVKVAGDINSARDYPPATRDQRLGDHVIVALTVGMDGRVKGCRVHRASRDPQSDEITCRLASERFRFRPATDAAGNPIESIYGWRQRWFDPAKKD